MVFILLIIIFLSLLIYKYVIFNFKIFKPIKYLSNNYINIFNNTNNVDNDEYVKIYKEYIDLVDKCNTEKIKLKNINEQNLNLSIKKEQLINIYDNLLDRDIKMEEFIEEEKDKIIIIRFLKIFKILYFDYLIKEDNNSLINKFKNGIFKTYLDYLIKIQFINE